MMWTTGLVIVAVALHLPSAKSLECYDCTEVAQLADCKSVVQCPAGSSCHATFKSNKYTLGCTVDAMCPFTNTTSINLNGGSGTIVGRSVTTAVQNGCSQCCRSTNCNRKLCQSDDPTCHDSGTIDCALTATVINICSETDHAKKVCKNFCGLCNLVDGNWSPWTSWSKCSVTCSNGTELRTRSCTDPSPTNGGSNCTGLSHQTRKCTSNSCPVNGGWSDWGTWSICSVTCDIGLRRRDRSCSSPYPSNSGVPCFGDARNDEICTQGACEDGQWADWGSWAGCSQSCDHGVEKRSRTCTNPPPSILGKGCSGDSIDVKTCFLRSCIDERIGFTVSSPADTVPSGGIRFTTVVTNEGGAYSSSTGNFTCPVSGVYFFNLNLIKGYSSSVTYAQCWIYRNSNVLGQAYTGSGTAAKAGYYGTGTSVYVHLSAGDKVHLYSCTSAHTMYGYTSFSGLLIKAD